MNRRGSHTSIQRCYKVSLSNGLACAIPFFVPTLDVEYKIRIDHLGLDLNLVTGLSGLMCIGHNGNPSTQFRIKSGDASVLSVGR